MTRRHITLTKPGRPIRTENTWMPIWRQKNGTDGGCLCGICSAESGKIIRSPWNWKSGSSNLNGNGNSSRSTDSYGCVVTGGCNDRVKYDAENERLTQALKTVTGQVSAYREDSRRIMAWWNRLFKKKRTDTAGRGLGNSWSIPATV